MPVRTTVLRPDRRARLHERMAAQMRAGRQCYIVYPLVEESEASDLADATSMAEELQSGPFREFRVGLLHGRMKADEKDAVMRRFKAGEIHCLVATTVIEVGIDVPNATVMLIESAEQFGLAQLHQLRGRVGRGAERSFCVLLSDAPTRDSAERMNAMASTSDGFAIAEIDLKMRGPGDFFGTRQSGLPQLKVADLSQEMEMLKQARDDAAGILERDADLRLPVHAALRQALIQRFGDSLGLAAVG
jgi:ATP-dependent DNA helicase RecG